MSNTILILTDIHDKEIRINVDKIVSYSQYGDNKLNVVLGDYSVQLKISEEKMDEAMRETYFMVKRV